MHLLFPVVLASLLCGSGPAGKVALQAIDEDANRIRIIGPALEASIRKKGDYAPG